MFQSTPPHGGRLFNPFSNSLDNEVSIHAPAWGATGVVRIVIFFRRVSIHAPAWGATRLRCGKRPMIFGFNPRPRMGGDLQKQNNNNISLRFNPRPRMGGDEYESQKNIERKRFQSTPPHGGRHCMDRGGSGYFRVSIHAPAWGATFSGSGKF